MRTKLLLAFVVMAFAVGAHGSGGRKKRESVMNDNHEKPTTSDDPRDGVIYYTGSDYYTMFDNSTDYDYDNYTIFENSTDYSTEYEYTHHEEYRNPHGYEYCE